VTHQTFKAELEREKQISQQATLATEKNISVGERKSNCVSMPDMGASFFLPPVCFSFPESGLNG